MHRNTHRSHRFSTFNPVNGAQLHQSACDRCGVALSDAEGEAPCPLPLWDTHPSAPTTGHPSHKWSVYNPVNGDRLLAPTCVTCGAVTSSERGFATCQASYADNLSAAAPPVEDTVPAGPTQVAGANPGALPKTVCCTKYSVSPFPREMLCHPNLLRTPPPTPVPVGFLLSEHFVPVSGADPRAIDPLLSFQVGTWMHGLTGKGKCGISARTDALCGIVQYLTHRQMGGYCRSKHDDRESEVTRYDRADLCRGVPVLLTEEDPEGVHYAAYQLEWRFHWLPHYGNLPYVFGIAISPDRMKIYTLHKEYPTTREVFQADLTDLFEHWPCVIAAINIARVILTFTSEKMLFGSAVRFDSWHERSTKSIRLGMQFFEVKFDCEDTFKRMVRFYTAMNKGGKPPQVPHLEKLCWRFSETIDESVRTLKLVPVGVARLPSDTTELITCIKHICDALCALHKLQWMHCDVRWANIVEHFGEWTLIDCEYAVHAVDDAALLARRSKQIKPHRVLDTETAWSPPHDLYQVGLMLQKVEDLTTASPPLVKLRDLLLSKKFTAKKVQQMINKL